MPHYVTTLAAVFAGECIPTMIAACVRHPDIAARVCQLALDLSEDEAEAGFWQAMIDWQGDEYV